MIIFLSKHYNTRVFLWNICSLHHGYYVHEPFNQSAAVKYARLKHWMSIMYLVEKKHWNWHLICNCVWHVVLWFTDRTTNNNFNTLFTIVLSSSFYIEFCINYCNIFMTFYMDQYWKSYTILYIVGIFIILLIYLTIVFMKHSLK